MKNKKGVLGFVLGIITYYIVVVCIEFLFRYENWFDMGQHSTSSIFYQAIFSSLMFSAVVFSINKRRDKKGLKNN